MRGCVVLGVVGLVACGRGKATLDQADVQAKVAAEAAKSVGVQVASATCPAASPKAGSSFECSVSFQGGGALTYKVDQVDANGSLAIAPKGDWLLGDRMERDLVTEMFLIGHPTAKVDCGNAVMPVTLPANVQCSVQGATGTTKIAVAVDANRQVNWTLVP
jgi:hypothetical protein